MTSIADANDKWASFAGPGAWNGNKLTCITMYAIKFKGIAITTNSNI
jgi:hypothetical protein